LNRFRLAFPRSAALLVVVHAETSDQAIRNVSRAKDSGADGVFLINHRIEADALVACYEAVRLRFPDWWIGLSFIGLNPAAAFDLLPQSASGLWVGDAEIDEENGRPSREAKAFADRRITRRWKGLYFGGVAFKHQRPVQDVALAAVRSVPHIDVVTTSGSGTGMAAPLEKIAVMKGAIGHHPLAIASGIGPENVHLYLPMADCFLVATAVSDSEAELNPLLIAKLATKIKAGI